MQNQDHLKPLHSDDINRCVKELPTLQVHIRDDVPKIQGDIKSHANTEHDYVRINTKKNLSEAAQFPYEKYMEVDRIANAIHNSTDDYHEGLDRLHRNIDPFIPEGKTSNAIDNYIYDVLKRGRPSGVVVSHIHDTMYAEHPEFDKKDNTNNLTYLTAKYSRFLGKHATSPQSIKYPHEAAYTKDELNNIPDNFQPMGLRILSHIPSGHFYEYHPTEGLKFIANSNAARYRKDLEKHNEFQKTDAHLYEHYEPFASKHITQYTSDSAPLNRFHFFDHVGKISDDTSQILGNSVDDLKELSTKISNHIKATPAPTHLPDFHVYTGLFGTNNPRTQATHTDESGKLLFHVPAFTSTSLNFLTAHDFAKMKNDGSLTRGFGDVLRIKLPGGYHHGVYAKPHSEHTDEDEYLLDKGHTFKINPEPTYHAYNKKIVRVWDAEVHHRESDFNTPINELSTRTEKLDRLMHPAVSDTDVIRAQYDADTSVRAAAARHPKATRLGLEALAQDRSPKVRQATMLNPNLSHEQMHTSLSDVDSAKTLASRHDIPPHILNSLVQHESTDVNAEVAKRHDLLPNQIGHLINKHDDSIMESLAGNKSLHPDLLHEFRNYPDHKVRIALANNMNAREDTLRNMLYDTHGIVSTAANDSLQRKVGIVRRS